MSNNRISWIDLSKSISLIFVITVHSLEINLFSAILTGVAMPVFFILYGLAHNNEKHRDRTGPLLKSRFKSLMIPYFILSIAMVFIYAVVYNFTYIDVGLPPEEFIFWTIYGNGPIQRVSHLWYLRTMFFAIVFFQVFDRYLHDKPASVRFLIALVLPALGVWMKSAASVDLLPWSIDSAVISLSFLIIGNEIRKYQKFSSWGVDRSFDSIAVILASALFIMIASINGYVNIGMSTFGLNIYLYIITGFLGAYVLAVLSYHACNHFDIALKISRFNDYAQEIYELHPMMIELNVQLIGGLTVWNLFVIFPDTPLFVFNLLTAVFVSWLIASKVITKSKILQFMFLGKAKYRAEPAGLSGEFKIVRISQALISNSLAAVSRGLASTYSP
ncbi:MAG: acyltransferase family protein [Candidatus Thorarchaeota archaeon]